MATRCRICDVPIETYFTKDGKVGENCSVCEVEVRMVCELYRDSFNKETDDDRMLHSEGPVVCD